MSTHPDQGPLYSPEEISRWAAEYTSQGGSFREVVAAAFHHVVTETQREDDGTRTHRRINRADELLSLPDWQLFQAISGIISGNSTVGRLYHKRMVMALNSLPDLEAEDLMEAELVAPTPH